MCFREYIKIIFIFKSSKLTRKGWFAWKAPKLVEPKILRAEIIKAEIKLNPSLIGIGDKHIY